MAAQVALFLTAVTFALERISHPFLHKPKERTPKLFVAEFPNPKSRGQTRGFVFDGLELQKQNKSID